MSLSLNTPFGIAKFLKVSQSFLKFQQKATHKLLLCYHLFINWWSSDENLVSLSLNNPFGIAKFLKVSQSFSKFLKVFKSFTKVITPVIA
jgi:hypothetical protein